MNYRGRIIEELKKDTQPAILELMDLCGVPMDDEEHHQFRIDLKSLLELGKVIRVCTQRNRSGDDVVGYYELSMQ